MDFAQEMITTLHDMCIDPEKLKKVLIEIKEERPASVILPMLEEETRSPAISRIIDCLNEAKYINEVIVALSAHNIQEFENTTRLFKRLKLPNIIVWCNGPRIREILEELKNKGLDLTQFSGKGIDVWTAIGIASLENYAIALHDADILSYSEAIPQRLLFPIIEPELDFAFSKGFYSRINIEKRVMYGRTFRLFLKPLLDALAESIGIYRHDLPFIRYINSFRYALSGEIAITSDIALNIRIPADWGLEIGLLVEVMRNVSLKRICQVDLGYYDHKHRQRDSLVKMSEDILGTVLRTITEMHGITVSQTMLLCLQVVYRRIAQDTVRQYYAEAMFNCLSYDRHIEESFIEAFAGSIATAGKKYLKNPTAKQIPDWLRAMSAMPDLREKLRSAALRDMECSS